MYIPSGSILDIIKGYLEGVFVCSGGCQYHRLTSLIHEFIDLHTPREHAYGKLKENNVIYVKMYGTLQTETVYKYYTDTIQPEMLNKHNLHTVQ